MRAKGGLVLGVSVSEAGGGGCIEAETEETVLVLEIAIGMVLETLQRKEKDGLGRKAIKGNALRNRDMLFFSRG